MPGFGSGRFGDTPFGRWDWSDQVMFQLLPSEDKRQDTLLGFPLRRFISGLKGVFDMAGDQIRSLTDIQDPLLVRARTTDLRGCLLGRSVAAVGRVLARARDGFVTVEGTFTTPTGRFEMSDRGRVLELRSVVPENTGPFKIVQVLDAQNVLVDPATALDASMIRWVKRESDSSTTTYIELWEGDLAEVGRTWVVDDGSAEFRVVSRDRFPEGSDARGFQKALPGGFIQSGRLVCVGMGFQILDVGKPIVVRTGVADGIDGDSTAYRIGRVLDVDTAELVGMDGSAVVVGDDVGPLDVTVLHYPIVEIDGTVLPKGVVLQHGIDGQTVLVTQFRALSATFSSRDVGRYISIMGSAQGNDGDYRILALVNSTTVNITGGTLNAETRMRWATRDATTSNSPVRVNVRAPNLLRRLASSYGLPFDVQESDARARTWLSSAPRWMEMKGLAESYAALGLVSGFDVTARPLWAISRETALGLPSADVLEVGIRSTGAAGIDGSLFADGTVTLPSASFVDSDSQAYVRIRNAATGTNNGLFEIDSVIDGQTLILRPDASPYVTDANNGTLQIALVRLYTTLEPLLPRYEEVNSDLMGEMIPVANPGKTFLIDQYCWDADWSSDIPVVVTSVFAITPKRQSVTVTCPVVGFPDGPEAVQLVGNWVFEDADGNVFYLETVPVGGPAYTFEVVASGVAPGAGIIRYECDPQIRCGYCAASAIALDIEYGTLASESGEAIEKALERLLRRIDQVRPIHVRLIPRLRAELLALWNITAEIETSSAGVDLGLYAPFTAYYDDIPADDVIVDTAIVVDVETP